jgi:hypothetical protein
MFRHTPARRRPVRSKTKRRFETFLKELDRKKLVEILHNILLLWGLLFLCGARSSSWQIYACFVVVALFLARRRARHYAGTIRLGLLLDIQIFIFANLWLMFASMS